MKYLIIVLLFAVPLAYGDPLYNETWVVYENINGEWVVVENAQITTDYTVYLGDTPYLKFEKSFTNLDYSPTSEPREFGFMQSIEEYETTGFSRENIEQEPEFGVIALMILAVAIISIIAVTAKTRLEIHPSC